jgi:hypothetical protein
MAPASPGAQAEDMDTIVLGKVEITRVVELPAKGRARAYVFPDVPVEHWQAHENWLAPTFLDPAADEIHIMIQTWLIRGGGRTILIDTGIGNDRQRPAMPSFHHLNTPYLGELAAAGVCPQDVDTVICTRRHHGAHRLVSLPEEPAGTSARVRRCGQLCCSQWPTTALSVRHEFAPRE